MLRHGDPYKPGPSGNVLQYRDDLGVAILEGLDLFRNASRSSLEALARSAEQIVVPAGVIVMAEGDHADFLRRGG